MYIILCRLVYVILPVMVPVYLVLYYDGGEWSTVCFPLFLLLYIWKQLTIQLILHLPKLHRHVECFEVDSV